MKMIYVKKEVFLKATSDAKKGRTVMTGIQESVVIDSSCAIFLLIAVALKVCGFLPMISGDILWMGFLFFVGNIIRNISIARDSE